MTRKPFHRAGEAERRQELITATLDCIAESGLRGATVREIATRAGVTGGLIRHYFTSKDQMIEAAYGEIMQTMNGSAIEASREGADAKTRLRNFIVANVTPPVTDARNLSLWASFISHVRTDPAFAAIHRENYLAYLNALEGLIAAVLADEERKVTNDECREYAIAINGLIDGLWLEGTLARDLFEENALPRIALRSIGAVLGGLEFDTDDATN